MILTSINAFFILLLLCLERFFYFHIKGFAQCFIFPLLITSWEFLQCFLPGTSGTWSALGFSQLENPCLLQAASLFGLFFLTFIISYVGSFLNWLQDEKWIWHKIKKPAIVTMILFSALFFYGNIQQIQKISTLTTRLAGITSRDDRQQQPDYTQTNYDYWEKRLSSPGYVKNVINHTQQAINSGAKIIVWQEACVFINEKQQSILTNNLCQMASHYRVCILAAYLLLKDRQHTGKLMQNKAVMIKKSGKITFQYKKAFLVPGIEDVIIDPGSKTIPVIDTEYGRIGTEFVMICNFRNI
jgi:apolipoprotein N-acyltransferase